MPDPHDPINWIKHLEGPEPPAEAPEWDAQPQHRRWRGPAVGLAVAMAATLLLWVALPTDDGVRLRGDEGAVDIDLRVVALTDAGPQRLRSGQVYATGQNLVFRVGATPAGEVFVWAEGPGGRVELGSFDLEPVAVDLQADGGLLALELAQQGSWTVFTSAVDFGNCPADACASRTIDVADLPQ